MGAGRRRAKEGARQKRQQVQDQVVVHQVVAICLQHIYMSLTNPEDVSLSQTSYP